MHNHRLHNIILMQYEISVQLIIATKLLKLALKSELKLPILT